MNIAIIGTGISGNVAAYHLSEHHQVTVFEKNDYIGGHTHTHDVEINGKTISIDSGFIVFNDRTYPKFNALLNELGVAAQKTEMSFSVKCDVSGLEYKGSGLNAMFAQRRNILNPRFYKLIFDIIRFNKIAKRFIQQPTEESLNEFLMRYGFSDYFSQHYLLPMGAAIWSTDPVLMRGFPARFFLRFFENHGLLDLKNRPQWYVVPGGSKQYIAPLVERFKESIKLNAEISSVRRADNGVYLQVKGQEEQFFDAVFIAAHSDQALAMLSDATDLEQSVLGAIEYQENQAILHTDESLLPKRRNAWSAWNYHLGNSNSARLKGVEKSEHDPVALSYNMNILQSLDVQKTFCVTLNNGSAIDPSKVIKRLNYHHPIFTPDSVAAQARQSEINGQSNTYFCGAYWGNGFHEDGVLSALNAIEHLKCINASTR